MQGTVAQLLHLLRHAHISQAEISETLTSDASERLSRALLDAALKQMKRLKKRQSREGL